MFRVEATSGQDTGVVSSMPSRCERGESGKSAISFGCHEVEGCAVCVKAVPFLPPKLGPLVSTVNTLAPLLAHTPRCLNFQDVDQQLSPPLKGQTPPPKELRTGP
eukprot:3130423-Pleurochrysis_carterae.AAC.1